MRVHRLLPRTPVAGRSFGRVIERDRLGSLTATGIERRRALVDDHGVVCVRALPEDRRDDLERSHGVHSIDDSLPATLRSHHGVDVADELRRRHPPVRQEIVCAHAAWGAPPVASCPMWVRSIAELDDDGSARSPTELDGRHEALTDHAPRRRVVRRCVAGHAGDRT